MLVSINYPQLSSHQPHERVSYITAVCGECQTGQRRVSLPKPTPASASISRKTKRSPRPVLWSCLRTYPGPCTKSKVFSFVTDFFLRGWTMPARSAALWALAVAALTSIGGGSEHGSIPVQPERTWVLEEELWCAPHIYTILKEDTCHTQLATHNIFLLRALRQHRQRCVAHASRSLLYRPCSPTCLPCRCVLQVCTANAKHERRGAEDIDRAQW